MKKENGVRRRKKKRNLPTISESLELLFKTASLDGKMTELLELLEDNKGEGVSTLKELWAKRLQEIIKEEDFQERLKEKCKVDVMKLSEIKRTEKIK